MVKFIHCADIHLDAPFSGLGTINQRLQQKLLTANYESFERIIELAITEKVDFVLIGGDLFDSPQRSLESQLKCRKLFAHLEGAGIKVFIVGGNHDPLKESFKLKWPENVYFFSHTQGETHFITINGENVYIHGISYQGEREENNLTYFLPNARDDGFNIGLLHCEIGRANDYSPCNLSNLKEKGYDYFALGHIHQGSILSTNPYVVYSGCHQGKNIKETGEKGCYIVSISKNNQVQASFVKTNSIQWFAYEIDISELSFNTLYTSLQEIMVEMESMLNCDGAIVRFTLKGRGEIHSLSLRELDEIVAEMNEGAFDGHKFIWVESIQKETRPDYDLVHIANKNPFLSTLLNVEYKGFDTDLEILKSLKIRKIVGDLDLEEIFNGAKEELIEMLLGGESLED